MPSSRPAAGRKSSTRHAPTSPSALMLGSPSTLKSLCLDRRRWNSLDSTFVKTGCNHLRSTCRLSGTSQSPRTSLEQNQGLAWSSKSTIPTPTLPPWPLSDTSWSPALYTSGHLNSAGPFRRARVRWWRQSSRVSRHLTPNGQPAWRVTGAKQA